MARYSFKLKKAAIAAFFISLFLVTSCAWLPHRHSTGQYAPAAASAHSLATEAAMQVLHDGGNAFDAAVAMTAALAVVEPTGSGLGGGGFYLLHHARDSKNVMIDAREKAPGKAFRDMYLDADGEVIPRLSLDGPLAAGIPGIPAALAHLAKNYGNLSLKKSLQPAIRLARNGFEVGEHYQRLARFRDTAVKGPARAVFLPEDKVPAVGERITQPDLADTLEAIAKTNADDFYRGDLAKRLVKGVREAGGIWSQKDLEQYEVVEREPVIGEYHGARITSAALPSSGGVVLMEMLKILEGFDLDSSSEAQRAHLNIEAMRRAYRDRAEYLGDPDFVKVDTQALLSAAHIDEMRSSIGPNATPSSSLKPVETAEPEGENTTHFSIIDGEGNYVAATLSINYPFGSGFMPPGTGVLLNNEMDDFSIKPGEPNVYGLVGAEANAIEAGKRPLSSMTPTFMETDDGLLIFGTPGGSRIITMVLLSGLEFLHHRGEVADWVALPRYHHQYLPDVVEFEPNALSEAVQTELIFRGHELKELGRTYGNMQAVYLDKATGMTHAASDPRGEGEAKVGTDR